MKNPVDPANLNLLNAIEDAAAELAATRGKLRLAAAQGEEEDHISPTLLARARNTVTFLTVERNLLLTMAKDYRRDAAHARLAVTEEDR